MSPQKKVLLSVLIYCAFLWLTNWSLTRTSDSNPEALKLSFELRSVGVLFGSLATIVLARKIWHTMRRLLELRISIPAGVRLWGEWKYLVFLLPLGISYRNYSDSFSGNGVSMRWIFEYGGSFSVFAILPSALAIMLFQTLVKLESFNPIHPRETSKK